MKDIISKSTRREFRECLVNYTPIQIETLFIDQDFKASSAEVAQHVSGQRRTLIEQFYNGINFANLNEMKRLSVVFAEVIHDLERSLVVKGYPELSKQEESSIRATIDDLLRRMNLDGFSWEKGSFRSLHTTDRSVHIHALALTHVSVMEHVEKTKAKIDGEDYAGAIASAYTLVESLLKLLLQQLVPDFKESEGDIRHLFTQLKGPLNLDPGKDSIESYLKSILQGFQAQVGGLYELANKASDRHARRYNPVKHHAKLAVNCAVTLCEFLLESYQYQQDLAKKRIAR